MSKYCPHCGSTVRLELDIGFLVCKVCCELLYADELVPGSDDS